MLGSRVPGPAPSRGLRQSSQVPGDTGAALPCGTGGVWGWDASTGEWPQTQHGLPFVSELFRAGGAIFRRQGAEQTGSLRPGRPAGHARCAQGRVTATDRAAASFLPETSSWPRGGRFLPTFPWYLCPGL